MEVEASLIDLAPFSSRVVALNADIPLLSVYNTMNDDTSIRVLIMTKNYQWQS